MGRPWRASARWVAALSSHTSTAAARLYSRTPAASSARASRISLSQKKAKSPGRRGETRSAFSPVCPVNSAVTAVLGSAVSAAPRRAAASRIAAAGAGGPSGFQNPLYRIYPAIFLIPFR